MSLITQDDDGEEDEDEDDHHGLDESGGKKRYLLFRFVEAAFIFVARGLVPWSEAPFIECIQN